MQPEKKGRRRRGRQTPEPVMVPECILYSQHMEESPEKTEALERLTKNQPELAHKGRFCGNP